jgi:hypothetical protein
MRRWNLLPIVLLGAAACGAEEPAADDQAPLEQQAPAAMDTSIPAPPPMQTPAAEPSRTGTVNPAMTRDEVIGVWGPPVAERATGAWTYLYFRNGCEVSCGTFDVVFLENGAVVNAIVRGPGHTYSGVSTSPPGQEGRATPPTGTEG